MSLLDHFDRLYVINLPSKVDRRRSLKMHLFERGLAGSLLEKLMAEFTEEWEQLYLRWRHLRESEPLAEMSGYPFNGLFEHPATTGMTKKVATSSAA